MSIKRTWAWVCDRCGKEDVPPPEEQTEHEDDLLMPYNWIHTMMGDDLCPWCQSEGV